MPLNNKSYSITNNLRFPGQYYDSETGLHYNYFRDYKPEIGRYIEADRLNLARVILLKQSSVGKFKDFGNKILGPKMGHPKWGQACKHANTYDTILQLWRGHHA